MRPRTQPLPGPRTLRASCRQRPALRDGALALAASVLAGPAAAHSFGPVYTLPLPFWMYAWGAGATLLLSFVLAAWWLRAPRPQAAPWRRTLRRPWRRPRCGPGRALTLGLLLLTLASALWGSPRAPTNLGMTLFWVLFLVGGLYAAALLGDGYRSLNPWATLAELLARLLPRRRRPPLRLGRRWRHLPAVALLLGLVWLELFGRAQPLELAWLLGLYTVLMLGGAALFGRARWFRHGDLFALLYRLLGSLAPLHWRGRQLTLRPPLLGAEQLRVRDTGLVLLLLTWLATTAFDGLHQSALWHRWFFVDLYGWGLRDWAGSNPLAAYPRMRAAFGWWNSAWLLLLPLLYLAVYALTMRLTRVAAGSGPPARELGWHFAPSLLPIVLAYHAAHYYTLLPVQGVKALTLISDPFARGWDLFGTAGWLQRTVIPEVETVWRAQLLLIVGGHVAGVWLAHRAALRIWPQPAVAARSQGPLLLLMIGLTVGGLWLLSLPPVR